MTTRIQEFDFSVDVLRVLLWEFNDAETLEGLLREKQAFYDLVQQNFWQDWLRDVFDLRTANDFGLAVWTNILGVPLFNDTGVSPDSYPAFGFDTSDPLQPIQNFNNGNFATSSDNFINLDTTQRRILLQVRYFQLTTSGTVSEINEFFANLVGPGIVYVIDNLDMTLNYVFTIRPPSNLLLVAEQFDIIPRPSGVGITLVFTNIPRWGFGPFRRNFERGNFFTGGAS